jgi:predicted HTH transcriptional regulator
MLDLFNDDIEMADPAEIYKAIEELARTTGPEEGSRLEFKETLDAPKAIPTIAAFANCFGGLLVLGVQEKGRSLVGVTPPGRSGPKNYLLQKIDERIFPFPDIEVATCDNASIPGTKLAIVRVRAKPALHWYVAAKTMHTESRSAYARSTERSQPTPSTCGRFKTELVRPPSTLRHSTHGRDRNNSASTGPTRRP